MPGEDNFIKKIITNVANAVTGVNPDTAKTTAAEGQAKEPEFVLELADDLLGDQVKLSGNNKKATSTSSTTSTSSKANDKEAKEAVKDMLTKLFNEDGIKKLTDKNSDGVTLEEARDYLKSIMDGDNNDKNLSIKDIEKALNALGIDPEKILNDKVKELLGGEDTEAKKAEEAKAKEEAAQAQQQAQSAGGAGGASGAGGAGGASGGGGVGPSGGVSGGGAPGGASGIQTDKAADTESLDNMSVEEIQEKITEKEGEISDSEKELSEVSSGEHEEIAELKEAEEKAFEDYQKKIEEKDKEDGEKLTKAKQDVDSAQEQLDNQENLITQKEGEIKSAEQKISDCESRITSLQGSIDSLQAAISSAEEGEDTSDLSAKLSAAQAELEQAEADKAEAEKQKEQLETEKTELTEERDNEIKPKLEEAQKALKEIEDKYKDDEDIKPLKESYDKAKESLEKGKAELTEKIQGEIETKRGELDELNTKLVEAKNKASEKEFSPNTFDLDVELDTSSPTYQQELENIKKIFEQNRDKYEKVAEATGVPAELIAAIHYREGSCNFNTYLHNGQPLGQTTTIVPKGIYFEDWTEAAIDAIKSELPKMNGSQYATNSAEYCLDFAERYNGLGYRNKGVASPYVWAGTTKYTGGMYVSDGNYSASAKDKRPGVALIMQELMA